MVLDAHFGLVGMLGSEIKSSLLDILELAKSLVYSLTISGYGGEDDSPTSTAAKGSCSN